jgi:hypothetical protein
MSALADEQLGPFEKRPPGQYRRPEFYWRGGDVLREQEHLRDEHRKALLDLQAAKRRQKQLEDEICEAENVLREREGYTNALAAYLERDVSASQKETQMKVYLRQLEAQVEAASAEVAELRRIQNPSVAAILLKQKAFYAIEVQRMQKLVQNGTNQQNEDKRQIAACSVNQRYRDARFFDHELGRLLTKRQHLRIIVSRAKLEFEALPRDRVLTDDTSRSDRAALRRNIEAAIERLRMEERRRTKTPNRRAALASLLAQVAELNDRLVDIGLEKKVVNLAPLRERMLPTRTRGQKEAPVQKEESRSNDEKKKTKKKDEDSDDYDEDTDKKKKKRKKKKKKDEDSEEYDEDTDKKKKKKKDEDSEEYNEDADKKKKKNKTKHADSEEYNEDADKKKKKMKHKDSEDDD